MKSYDSWVYIYSEIDSFDSTVSHCVLMRTIKGLSAFMYFMPLYWPKVPSERKKVPGLIDICDISTNVYVSEWNENIREVRKIVKNERSYN